MSMPNILVWSMEVCGDWLRAAQKTFVMIELRRLQSLVVEASE